MYFNGIPSLSLLAVLVTSALCSLEIRREGWLDRIVKYHKMKFFNDVDSVAPYNIQAKIVPMPPGYTDSPGWTFDTVVQLLVLIRESEHAAPVRRALRRALRPHRRLMMSMADSFTYFPSRGKDAIDDIYYDVGSAEDYLEPVHTHSLDNSSCSHNVSAVVVDFDDSVIVVSNPVESRLPSAQISVRLLKDIMIQRSIAARGGISPTIRSTIPWKPMNKTTSRPDNKDSNSTSSASVATTPRSDDAGGGGVTGGDPGDAGTTAQGT